MNRYYANHSHYRKHHTKLTVEKRFEKAKKVLEYLRAHPCVDCGEKDPIVLEFDHRDGTEKVESVTQLVTNNCGWQKIEDEIAKCDVRCANCHRRRTAIKRGYMRALLCQEDTQIR